MTPTPVQQARELIGHMSSQELDSVVTAVKLQRTWLARQASRSVTIGSAVRFNARGRVIEGVVTKVNRKTIMIRENSSLTTWRVHATLVERA